MSWSSRASQLVGALALGGCGLVLQAGPPRPDAARSTLDAGSMDAARSDAGDAVVTLDTSSNGDVDGNVLDIDAAMPDIDAAMPDARSFDVDAGFDAGRPLTMPDGALASHDAADADAPDGDARDAPDGDARDAPDGDAPDGTIFDARVTDARTADAFCTASGGACDLLTQCGCPSAQACQFGPPPTFAPTCVLPGSVAGGGFCMTETDCGRGLTCAYLGAPPGVCAPFCVPGTTCTGGGLCLALGPPGDPLAVGACSPNCNPIATGSCAGGLVCDVANDPSSFSYCRVAGPAIVGRSCTAPTDCGARATCVGSVCRALCTGSIPCSAGTCTTFAPPISIGGFSIGFCAG